MSKGNDKFLLRRIVSKKYDEEARKLQDMLDICNAGLLEQYKKRFPGHKISQCHIKKFVKKLSRMKLLPDKGEYVSLHEKNEFFDIDISLCFPDDNMPLILRLPYPINVHKVTAYIKEKQIQKVPLYVSTLKEIIIPECFDDFNDDMQAKKEGRDLLEDIKKDNPVIVLYPGGVVGEGYLINGTHRTIQAVIDRQDVIDGYIVYPDVCKECGISEDYGLLYDMMLDLYDKVYGVYKQRV